jgi:hypothetical protein
MPHSAHSSRACARSCQGGECAPGLTGLHGQGGDWNSQVHPAALVPLKYS